MTHGRPTAAPPYFPYDHPSMAVVMAEEERQGCHSVPQRKWLIVPKQGHNCCATFQERVAK